jgi:hypothetical protein
MKLKFFLKNAEILIKIGLKLKFNFTVSVNRGKTGPVNLPVNLPGDNPIQYNTEFNIILKNLNEKTKKLVLFQVIFRVHSASTVQMKSTICFIISKSITRKTSVSNATSATKFCMVLCD